MSKTRIPIVRLAHAEGLPLPSYATPGSAGLDLHAAITEDVVLRPGARALIPAGFRIALAPGFEGQIRPRSGLAARHGVSVLNSPGTIDADYRGELRVLLINLGEAEFTVRRGDRIAQLVVAPVAAVTWLESDELAETDRGSSGFGSTGETSRKSAPRRGAESVAELS